MIYRIYVTNDRGYQRVGGYIAKKHLIKMLDNIMKTLEKHQKVLVIGHDIEMNADYPVFLNIVDDYEDFRKQNCSKKKMLKRENENERGNPRNW